MNVYVLMPVAKQERAVAAAQRWKAKGYKMLFFQDAGTAPYTTEPTLVDEYKGVWEACNRLARIAAQYGSDVCVFAGDDMDPDPKHTAEEIALEYLERFPDGYGVMQPCGDPQAVDETGRPAAARICGSAWFGQGWIKRAYQGHGPTNAQYWHFYADEELALVAESLGVLWWRPDLTQFHHHWSFGWTPIQEYHKRNQTFWEKDQALFFARKANGFPGHEPAEGVKA